MLDQFYFYVSYFLQPLFSCFYLFFLIKYLFNSLERLLSLAFELFIYLSKAVLVLRPLIFSMPE